MARRETFTKPALTLDEQLEQLQQRGMVVPDRQRALHALNHLNYYRLCAYWLPFEADHETHTFTAGADFERVLELYEFDRKLRLHVLDAIERVEISLRTQFAYRLGHDAGSHAHERRACFNRRSWHDNNLAALQTELERSDERFIEHYQNQYNHPETPPIWACCEIMSLGLLSRFIKNLQARYRQSIAATYGLPEPILDGLTHHLSHVRNVCAHHARLWNREFTITPPQPRRRPQSLRDSLVAEPGGGRPGYDSGRRIYNTLTYLSYLLSVVSPGDSWAKKLEQLMEHHRIDRDDMGFPADYAAHPVWAQALETSDTTSS